MCYSATPIFDDQFNVATVLMPKNIFGLCYHSVNVITFSLAQSDHIKRRLLYKLCVRYE
jgi:hypothetical protein